MSQLVQRSSVRMQTARSLLLRLYSTSIKASAPASSSSLWMPSWKFKQSHLLLNVSPSSCCRVLRSPLFHLNVTQSPFLTRNINSEPSSTPNSNTSSPSTSHPNSINAHPSSSASTSSSSSPLPPQNFSFHHRYRQQETAERNSQTGKYMIALALFTLALAYASVPLYRIFCQRTGFGGTTQRVDSLPVFETDTSSNREITVHFNAFTLPELPWKFVPVQSSLKVRIGEPVLAFFEATNTSDKPLTGVATYNVEPPQMGFYFHKIQCFCLAEGSIVSGVDGLGRLIQSETCMNEGLNGAVLSYDENVSSEGIIRSVSENLVHQGIKPCITIVLEDGRSLTCTPDHQILTNNGWSRADELALNDGNCRVLCGLDVVLDNSEDPTKEGKFSLFLPTLNVELGLFSSTIRNRTYAFFRLLGYMLANGHVHRHQSGIEAALFVDHEMDVQAVVFDLELLNLSASAVISHSVESSGKNLYQILLPHALSQDLVLFSNCPIEVTVHEQVRDIPSLIFAINTPQSIKREFLAAYFGGRSHPLSLSGSNELVGGIQLNNIMTQKSSIPLREKGLQQLKNLLVNDFHFASKTIAINVGEKNRINLQLSSSDILLFGETIGFRYNCQKQMQLTIACSWYRMQDHLNKEHESDELTNRSPLERYMPNLKSWLASIGANSVFSTEKNALNSSTCKKSLPAFNLKPMKIIQAGRKLTYDVPVHKTHNFLANGIVVHNCFDEQRLRAKETVDMPVFFYIDPKMEEDRWCKKYKRVTLSYTFFPTTNDDEEEEGTSEDQSDSNVREATQQPENSKEPTPS